MALHTLITEMIGVYAKYGVEVNYRHFTVLAGIMTHRGKLTPLRRSGIGSTDSGPLMRATFEKQLEVGQPMGRCERVGVSDAWWDGSVILTRLLYGGPH